MRLTDIKYIVPNQQSVWIATRKKISHVPLRKKSIEISGRKWFIRELSLYIDAVFIQVTTRRRISERMAIPRVMAGTVVGKFSKHSKKADYEYVRIRILQKQWVST